MPTQLPMTAGLRDYFAEIGRVLLADLAEAVGKAGVKRRLFSDDIGISESHLSEALAGNGKHFAVEWLPVVVRYDRERHFLRALAALYGCRVEPVKELTDADRLQLLREELRRSGADVDAIEARAFESVNALPLRAVAP